MSEETAEMWTHVRHGHRHLPPAATIAATDRSAVTSDSARRRGSTCPVPNLGRPTYEKPLKQIREIALLGDLPVVLL